MSNSKKETVLILSSNEYYVRTVSEVLKATLTNIHPLMIKRYSDLDTGTAYVCVLLDVQSMPEPQRYGWFPKLERASWIATNVPQPEINSLEWIEAGYSGVVESGIGLELLPRAVSDILNGDFWFPRETLSKIIRKLHSSHFKVKDLTDELALDYHLTPKEKIVCELMISGLSNSQIASRQKLSINTIKTHAANVLTKLKLNSRNQLIASVSGMNCSS